MVGKRRKDIVDEGCCSCSLGMFIVLGNGRWFGGGAVGFCHGSRDAPLGDVGWVAPTSVTSRSLPGRLIQTLRKGNLPYWLKRYTIISEPQKFEHRESNVSFRPLPLCCSQSGGSREKENHSFLPYQSPPPLPHVIVHKAPEFSPLPLPTACSPPSPPSFPLLHNISGIRDFL